MCQGWCVHSPVGMCVHLHTWPCCIPLRQHMAPVMPWRLYKYVVCIPYGCIVSIQTNSINYTLAVFVYTQRGSWACLPVHLSICLCASVQKHLDLVNWNDSMLCTGPMLGNMGVCGAYECAYIGCGLWESIPGGNVLSHVLAEEDTLKASNPLHRRLSPFLSFHYSS